MLFSDYIYKSRLPLFSKALDAYALRQKTIATNIANATTEGYKPQKVRFEEFFQGAVSPAKGTITGESGISMGSQSYDDVKAETYTPEVPEGEKFFGGESHVNIDREMSDMAQNQIRFRFASRMVKRYFSGLNTAITGFKE